MTTYNYNNFSCARQTDSKDILINISKFFFIIFLVYYGWFQKVFFTIPNMSLLLGAGMILFIIFHSLRNNAPLLRCITFEIIVWLLFTVTALLTGYVVAVNKSLVIRSLTNYFEYLVMVFGMVYISHQDKKINFFTGAYSIFALLCALTTIFFGVNYTSTRITMSVSTNPNTLGISMVIGIFCILYNLNLKKIGLSLFMICELFLFLYVIILIGSRKSLLSAFIVLMLWIVFVRKSVLANNKRLGAGGRLALVISVLIGSFLLYKLASNSFIFTRLEKLIEYGDDTRISMYIAAFELFKMSPFIGVGMDNYRALTVFSTYSHSTYAEVLSCTGVVGTILYFIPYCSIAVKIVKLIKNSVMEISINAKLLGILFFMLLFLGTGVIHFYNVSSYISLGFLVAFCSLYYKANYHEKVDVINETN